MELRFHDFPLSPREGWRGLLAYWYIRHIYRWRTLLVLYQVAARGFFWTSLLLACMLMLVWHIANRTNPLYLHVISCSKFRATRPARVYIEGVSVI